MRKHDLKGKIFGKLEVIKLSNLKKNKVFLWECKCKCGNIVYARTQNLMTGHKKSCGCGKLDLKGYCTGYLTVISESGVKKIDATHSERLWLCSCSYCGGKAVLSTGTITCGRVSTCGCLKFRNKDKHHGWKGFGEVSGSMWKQIKSCASVRDLEFSISIEYVWDIFLRQNRKCALSGKDIVIDTSTKGLCTASLDRIDSSKGYIEGNVQWVHKDINKMKTDFDQCYFIEMCKLIACKSCEG